MATPSRYSAVSVKSRCHFPIIDMLRFDGEAFDFAPFEEKHVTLDCARHLIMRSRVKFDPVTEETTFLLYEVTDAEAPPPLTWDEAHPGDILDRTHMPPTAFDDDGTPLKIEYRNIGFPSAMMRGRTPTGLAAAGVRPRDLEAGPEGHGIGITGPMSPAMRASLDAAHAEAHEKFAARVGLVADAGDAT